MPAAVYNFTIEQGTTFEDDWFYRQSDNVTPIPLTGYTARMQIRPTVSSPTVYFLATTQNGKLVIDGAAGKISLLLTDTDTSAMNWTTGVYDIEIVSPSGQVTRFLKGTITIDPEVTR